jgi:hypothetical protein
MSRVKSRQNVKQNVNSWEDAIRRSQILLERAENRAARLKGAIKTFSELRDSGQPFAEQMVGQLDEQQHSV